MMISTAAHAAQAVAPGQDARFYDDHGCLARDAAALPATARLFVQHDGGSGWLEAAEAFFARPREARTPMSYGLVAFSSREAAAHADRDGRAWRWADVLASVTP
jgi:copper chaperone NosL